MTNLGTTFTEWADDMKLDLPRGGHPYGIHHIGTGRGNHAMDLGIDQHDDGDIVNALGSDQTCSSRIVIS
jgi:hypothetical protein